MRSSKGHHVVHHAEGVVHLGLALLVADDVDLALEAALGNGVDEEAHAVGLHPQDLLEGVARNALIVDGIVVGGAAVEGAAHVGDLVEESVARQVLGALEEHVLEEMGEAGLALLLTCAADVECNGLGDDRVAVVLVKHDLEAVVQGVLLVVDVHDIAFLALA